MNGPLPLSAAAGAELLPEFPGAEALAVRYLQAAFPGLPVGTAPDTPRADAFLTVSSNGGPRVSINRARRQLTVHVYDVDSVAAEQRAERVSTVMQTAHAFAFPTTDGRYVQSVQSAAYVGGPTHIDDPTLPGVTRYRVVVDWLIRANP